MSCQVAYSWAIYGWVSTLSMIRAKLADFLTLRRGAMVAAAYNWGRNWSRAEDAVQEASRRVLASGKYDEVSNIEPWFWRIMRNAYLDAAKKRDEKNACLDAPLDDGFLTFADVIPAPDRPLSADMEADVEAAEIRMVLGSLRPRMKAVLRRVDMEEQNYASAARSLGWPCGTVRSTLSRAREEK